MKTVLLPFARFNQSGLGCGLTILLGALLLGSIGLGWVVNGVLLGLAFLLVAPIVGLALFRWWLGQNLIEGSCPMCGYEFTGFNGSECRCPSCGEALKVEQGNFVRLTPPGTIDIDAVDVTVQALED